MTWMPDALAEWLETDGLGGYAMGTVGGRRTRKYHGLLITARTPPTDRVLLVNGFDATIEIDGSSVPLSTQLYPPYVVAPDNSRTLDGFTTDPWPTWQFLLPDGRRITQELLMPRGRSATILRWRCQGDRSSPVRLQVTPFLSGRDHHAIHHENPAFEFEPTRFDGGLVWQPYPDLPPIVACTNGFFHPHHWWYRQFLYEQERERGLEELEDLAAPGVWTWNLATTDAVLIWSTNPRLLEQADRRFSPGELAEKWIADERARRLPQSSLRRLTDAYLVETPQRTSLIAGYPWFTDWGRDTFISLRGLCLATGDFATAGTILDAWSGLVSEGMLPNRFPDSGGAVEYNSVDASLWYVLVVHEYLTQTASAGWAVPVDQRQRLLTAVEAILTGYATGTRYQIHRDDDGLIAAGVPGVQLTWMDAKVGDWVVTPRIGKPVEIQALWLNALAAFPDLLPEAARWLQRGLESFREKFWNHETGCLYDVVDVNHQPGTVDARLRPNQIFALGGFPLTLVAAGQAAQALQVVEEHLLTPLGLRTLSPMSPEYCGRYQGNVRARDGAYHQGTVWPWLLGAFVEAWLKVHGDTPANRQLARGRFLTELERHRKTAAGLNHLSEIMDGDSPWSPRGCPFQAWSVGEWIRLDQQLLQG